jgi:hypothetical protein
MAKCRSMRKITAMNLLNTLQQAFAKRQKPKQLVASDHPPTDIYDDATHFHDVLWINLTGNELERFSDAFYAFNPLAFCYFLPGVLCASIRENEPGLIIISGLIGMLDRSPDISLWDTFFLERWTLLSKSECEAIQEWVLWLAEFDDTSFTQDSLTRAYETLGLLSSENDAFVRFRKMIPSF